MEDPVGSPPRENRRETDLETSPSLLSSRATLVLAVLLLVNVFNFMDRQLPFILSESIKRDLQLSDTQLGMLSGLAFVIVYSLAALPLARLADRWSPKLTLASVVALWSSMTLLGGFAKNFLQLGLTRAGVALGEAGSTPASHAIIQRSIPKHRRGLALGIFQMGAPAGAMLGMALGGWLNDVVGWRTTMIAAGALGGVVVLMALLCIPDTRLKPSETGPAETYWQSVRGLLKSPAFAWMFVAMCLVGATVYPTLAFSTPFLIRVHGFSTTEAGLTFGLLQGIAGIIGTIIGGIVFDRGMRGRRDRLLTWPAMSFLIAAPLTLAGWLVDDPQLGLILLTPIGFAVAFYFPAMYGSAHIIAGPTKYATASGLLIVGSNLIGGIIGPLIVGMISDQLTPTYGAEAIRYALIYVPIAAVASGAAFWMSNRRLAAALGSADHS